MKEPFVSVIMPVYGVEAYIGRCLESLAAQTFKDFEVVVVDDCTPDASMEIVGEFKATHPDMNIRTVRRSQNGGLSAARNSGIHEARGKYLYFLDSDDDITSECLQLLSAPVINGDVDVVITGNTIVKSSDRKEITPLLKPGIYEATELFDAFLARRWYSVAWNKLVRRELVLANKLFFAEGKILEDELWSFQLAAVAKSLVVVEGHTYNYYVREKSTLTSVAGSAKRWLIFLEINKLEHEFIVVRGLQGHAGVQQYVFRNIQVNMNGLERYGALDYTRYKQLRTMNIARIGCLRKNGIIGFKEAMAYRHLNMPAPLGYAYCKIMKMLGA